MEHQALITLMADGQYHSGEVLGKKLGISRAAIWKQLQKLEQQGVVIESLRGKGYRLLEPIEFLNEATIRQKLNQNSIQWITRFTLCHSIDSTNLEMARQLRESDIDGCVVIAEYQTAGKGRRGRTWVSPFGHNLYLSVGWNFPGGIKTVEGLSLALGVTAAKAIEAMGVEGIELKWPNDLLIEGKKVGGILVEIEGDPAGLCKVIAGIGINTSKAGNMSNIDQPWTDLSSIKGQTVSRNQLVANILNFWLPLLAGYGSRGFSHYRNEWLSLDSYANKPVELIIADKHLTGIARGVDKDGSLLLEIDGKVLPFSGGEISLRGVFQ